MLRYKYEDSLRQQLKTCGECKKVDKCHFHIRRTEYGKSACYDGLFEYHHPDVTSNSAEWILFQMQRDVQLAIGIASTVERDYFMDSHLSESMRDNSNDKPTTQEAGAFKCVMKAYREFLTKKRAELESKKGKKFNTDLCIVLVKSLIYNSIKVVDNEVIVFAPNCHLLNFLRKAVLKEKYSFRTVNNPGEAYNCPELITSEN